VDDPDAVLARAGVERETTSADAEKAGLAAAGPEMSSTV